MGGASSKSSATEGDDADVPVDTLKSSLIDQQESLNASGDRQSLSTSPAAHASCCHCPDAIFLVLWLGSVGAMGALAFVYGLDEIESGSGSEKGKSGIMKIFGLCLAVAIVVSQLWVRVMISCGGLLLKCMFLSASLLMSGMAALCISQGLPYFAIPFGVMTLLIITYFCCITNKIDLASQCLRTACKIVRAYPSTQLIALVMTVVSMVWSCLFAMALYGIHDFFDAEDMSSGRRAITWIMIILIYFWGINVCKNIVVCTTAGTAAEWWFARSSPVHPTWSAFDRAVTVNLGSICYGSFFVAVTQTVAKVVTKIKKKVDENGNRWLGAAMCCCVCLANCLAKIAEVFSSYAFIIVGMYGYGFGKAGGHTAKLFRESGILLLEMDGLVELVLAMGSVVVALITGAAGALIAEKGPDSWTDGVSDATLICGTIGAIMGFGVCQTCMSVVESANNSVLISWMENPHALEQNHPDEYHGLHETWRKLKRTEVSVDYAAEEGLVAPTETTVERD
mmetsp:Transcript_3008/g.4968  ORF Transcript_3008/g.4968 Transcript_3008/m.4968 type:complete len:509 (-) Transcript_3008:203-1729(-)|eukprot:CAMPEP_0205910908 /NCGR_PEP_ID=MMETSP1325-20131115/4772_1 /ASSEMBLY_ACC=CAM_ASM_000708 /TAXON_ID=236786 /ORGANISM="Florenciella sp., Strain RCC1007" /LENGTH=508 /DNA_ID=CAMNT_0053277347 /DNA_START=67 /DNA_END=1593 /DNA_ORIENTATION=-